MRYLYFVTFVFIVGTSCSSSFYDLDYENAQLASACNKALTFCAESCVKGGTCMACVRNEVKSDICDGVISKLKASVSFNKHFEVSKQNRDAWITSSALIRNSDGCNSPMNKALCKFACKTQFWETGICARNIYKCLCLNAEQAREVVGNETSIGTIVEKHVFGFLSIKQSSSLSDLLQTANNESFAKSEPWDLIYQGSVDGLETSKFHSKCDNKFNTLLIVKATNGFIFGGFTGVTWNHSGKLGKIDSDAFIFSLVNRDMTPALFWPRNDKSKAIIADASSGPIFGDYDFSISFNPNIKSRSNLGSSYNINAMAKDGAVRFLAGEQYFTFTDIAVYQKAN